MALFWIEEIPRQGGEGVHEHMQGDEQEGDQLMKYTWPFPEEPHTVVYTTRDIMEGIKPILLVTHDPDDGAWQFHSSTTLPAAEGRIVALEEIVFNEPSLAALADLPRGWRAVRDSVSSPWSRHPIMFAV